jgi:excisionase family DNA binding protein
MGVLITLEVDKGSIIRYQRWKARDEARFFDVSEKNRDLPIIGEDDVAEPKYSLPRVMTVRDLSAYLRVHPSTIYKLLRKGELPGFRIGTDWRFNAEVIDRWCFERNMKPSEEIERQN